MRRKPLFPPPSDDQGRCDDKGKQSRSVLSRNGRVDILRRRYHIPGQGSHRPADNALGIGSGRAITRGVRHLACLVNLHASSFAYTADCLLHTAHLRVSRELLRQCIEAQGQAVISAQQQMLPSAWNVQDCHVDAQTTRLYVGCDGVKVPMVSDAEKRKRRAQVTRNRRKRKNNKPLSRRSRGTDQPYKEFKIVIHYDEPVQHSHASVTRHNHRGAQMLMSRDARKLGLHKATQKIGNVDGADWIRARMQDARLNLDVIGLDFYHLSQHVHQARRQLFGDQNPDGLDWAGQILHSVKHEGYQAMWDQLQRERVKRRRAGRKALDQLLNYIAARREMIQYPRFIANGWQIGSGPTEASCKTLTARLKRSGMRWEPVSAEALANLNALYQNGQWEQYWKKVA